MRPLYRTPIVTFLFAALLPCAGYAQGVAPGPTPLQKIETSLEAQGVDVEALRVELRAVLVQLLVEQQLHAGATKGKSKSGGAESVEDRLKRRVREIGEEIRQRIFAGMQRLIDERLGPRQAVESETVMLDTLGKRGAIVQTPITVKMRPLRLLSEPANAEQATSIVAAEGFAISLYEDVPSPVSPVSPLDDEGFWRTYGGDNARAIKTEAKLLVSMKGGDWTECDGTRPAANVVAVRGLDLALGLKPNGNQTYDDTMYAIVDAPNADTEVFEYRMTTESSSAGRGVGRLASRQVTYVRGLHRGTDPAYRLKDDSAEGTRTGTQGTVKILGANIHSAYAKKTIDSTTPLAPNVSLGCQVVASGKKDFEKALVQLLDKKGVKEFLYTIVDGDELQVLDNALEQKSMKSVLAHGIARGPAATTKTGRD
ncbi:MAG: hypothetical protein FJY92_07320 [Candidatus Hydrogenedentes bacterium]|nr:hypothetical protein [Candidatus Hydrogenedentota bacterium]